MPSAVGNYVNFLHASSLVIVPSYGIDADEIVLTTLTSILPQFTVKSLECRATRRAGGVLNCCTWTIKSAADSSQL